MNGILTRTVIRSDDKFGLVLVREKVDSGSGDWVYRYRLLSGPVLPNSVTSLHIDPDAALASFDRALNHLAAA